MAPKKKKAKATANTSRGFATTSQPSKQKVVEPTDDNDVPSATTNSGDKPPAAKAEQAAAPATATDEQTIQQMSPEELEQHLEDAELQDILNRHGARCRAESMRQMSRLKTEQRQLRPQSYRLHTEDWLDEDITKTVLSHEVESGPVSSVPESLNNDNEKLLTDLWTLHRILDGLGLPRIEEAISYVVRISIQRQLTQGNYIPFGLTEALDWYAIQCSDSELPGYEKQFSTRPPTPTSEDIGESRASALELPATASGQSTAPGTPPQAGDSLNSPSEASTSSPSDAEVDDADPERMISRWIRLQRRLWQRSNPDVPDKRPNVVKSRRLQDKISAIERDILFEKKKALAIWKPIQIELQKASAKARKKHAAQQRQMEPCEDRPAQVPASDNAGEDEEDGVFGDMFGADGPATTPTATSSEPNVRILDFGTYTGLSPNKLLRQLCEKIDSKVRIKHTVLHQTSYAVRHSISLTWSKPPAHGLYAVEAFPDGILATFGGLFWKIEMQKVAVSSTTSSLEYVSTLALFLVLSTPSQDIQTSRRLPSVWAQLLSELSQQQKTLSERADKTLLRDLRSLIKNAESSNGPTETSASTDLKKRDLPSHSRKDKERNHPPRLTEEEAHTAWMARASGQAYQRMLKAREQLPIHQHKDLILQTIAQNPVSIICAETGSGKSTQAGSYILEQNLSQGKDCRILVTQPRRISAISLARRISLELGEGKNDLGTMRSLVGYAIRMESKTSDMTRLTFATTGVLLRMLESSATLDQLDYLILDEVHERSMEMDLTFIALRTLQRLRPSLKIVLMSATVNASQFSQYFADAPILNIEGRTFPVTVKYLEDAIEATNDVGPISRLTINEPDETTSSDDEVQESSKDTEDLAGYSKDTIRRLAATNEFRIDFDLIVKLAAAIATKPVFSSFSRAILIFMPGLGEIRRLQSALLGSRVFSTQWDIHMLHSTFTTDELERAFAAPPAGYRKIVIATNIAETGITIPDITAVIDTCKEKIMRFDERRQLSRLTEGFVARSSASQRRGRAARVQAGLCFHLVTRHRYDNLLLPQQVPEMLRLSLQDSIMRIKLWDNSASIAETLDAALDPPPRKNVTRAIERLKDAGALTTTERLSSLGQLVARLPLDVSLAKLAVLATIFTCLDPVLTIIALMTSKSIFLPNHTSAPTPPSSTKSNTLTGRLAFARSGSDLLTSLNAYTAYQRARTANQATSFARRHGLNTRALSDVDDARIQLLIYLVDGGLVALTPDERTALNRARSHIASSSSPTPSTPPSPLPTRYSKATHDDLLLSLIAAAFHPRLLIREGALGSSSSSSSTTTINSTKPHKSPRLTYRNPLTNQLLSPARASIIHSLPRSPTFLSYAEALQTRAGTGIMVQEVSRVPEVGVGVFLGLGADGGGGGGGGGGAPEEVKLGVYSGVLSLEGGKMRLSVGRWREAVAVKRLRRRVRWEVEMAIRRLAERRGQGFVGEDGDRSGEALMGKGEGDWAIGLLRGIGSEKVKDGASGGVKS